MLSSRLLRVVFIFAIGLTILVLFYSMSRIQAHSTKIEIEILPGLVSKTEQQRLRFATYNIAHGRGSKLGASNWDVDPAEREERLRRIGQFLKEAEIDIVVLNEVDFDANWSGRVDQASIIASAGEFPFFVRQNNYLVGVPGFSLQFGNVLLSKYPIVEAERIPLPALSKIEAIFFGNHDALRAGVQVGSSVIDVFGVHLEVRDELTRIAAVEHLSSQITAHRPRVVMGDLNSELASPTELNTALEVFLRLTELGLFPDATNPEGTFPTNNPNRTLDWVLYSSDIDFVEGEVGSAVFSDHLPVIVTLELGDPAQTNSSDRN